MNYQFHYNKLIETRRGRIKEPNQYYEKHHIIPKCINGSDDKENLVYFTAREHFIAHWLLFKLAKTNEDKFKMGMALQWMSTINNLNERKITSRQYETVRRIASIANSLRIVSDETKEKISKAVKERWSNEEYKQKIVNTLLGRVHSEETKQKMSDASKGITKSDEAKENMRLAWERRRLTPVSEETKQKMRDAAKHRPPISEETKQKLRDARARRK